MIPRLVLAAALLGGATTTLTAQAPDSAQQRYLVALVTVRDSLMPIGAAVQNLRRDLGSAAPSTVLAKTRQLHRACAAAQRTLAAQRPVVAAGGGGERVQTAARNLVREMRALDGVLTAECHQGLAAEGAGVRADTVRVWLPHRAGRLRAAEQRYHQAAAGFARVMGIRIPAVHPSGN